MEYFVSSADDDLANSVEEDLREHGVEVVDRYHEDAVIVSLGGDGSILYNARTHGAPTILPVSTGDSEANRIQLGVPDVVDRIDRLERGTEGEDYHVDRHRKLVATVDGDEVRGDFTGMNDVHLHHGSPVRGAKFRARVTDGDETVFETEKAIGDGLLVATPFGSTAYFRSIAGGTFSQGVGVAFNNLHKPVDAPTYFVLSDQTRVELEVHPVKHGANAVLVRDDDPEPYPLSAGTPVEISLSDRVVEVVRFDG